MHKSLSSERKDMKVELKRDMSVAHGWVSQRSTKLLILGVVSLGPTLGVEIT